MPIVSRVVLALVLLCAGLSAGARPALAEFIQQGSKLVGIDFVPGQPNIGAAVALSADGNTAAVGGNGDGYNNGGTQTGAVWIYIRSGDVWSQQGIKLVGSGGVDDSRQGTSVALSADGSTMIQGAAGDDSNRGAAWVFTRTNGVWTQQGGKLVGSGAVGAAGQGTSVAISADGNTAIVGGPTDSSFIGAAWVFTRSGGVWTEQTKLIGTGVGGTVPFQGTSVALSADGNTAAIGGHIDNNSSGTQGGAVWVFTRSGSTWTQQGSKLLATGGTGGFSRFGSSLAMSADGNTLIGGGVFDDYDGTINSIGAAWVFTRSGGVWTQQGNKLVGTDGVGINQAQGGAVRLSSDGNTAIVGGFQDNSGTGAAWTFTRSGGAWTQAGAKLVGTGAVGVARQGWSVALSGDGKTAFSGGYLDNAGVGAAWVFREPGSLQVTPATNIAASGNPGGPFSPSSFNTTLSSSASSVDFTITGVPSWLTASSTSGTVDGMGTTITFTVNASANSLGNGVVGPDTITFTNTTNGGGTTTRSATLTVSSGALQIAPAANIEASGAQFGPFVPASFTYILNAASGTVNYAITGVPSWLTASSISGTLTTALTPITFSVNASAGGLPVGSQGPSIITITNTTNGAGTATRTATLTVGAAGNTSVLSAILPASRSVQVGTPATAFATVINVGAGNGAACGLSLGTSIPATFSYQTTDPATNVVTGTPNTPVNIPPSGSQSYVFAIAPSAAFAATDVPIVAKCGNSAAAPMVTGLNTLLLSASAMPVPDIVALAASVDPGFVNLPGNTGTGAFSVASVNVGSGAAITVSADTGAATLPVQIRLCETDGSAVCVNPAFPGAPTVNLMIAANATPTFSIFVTGSGNVPNDPANNRVFVRFKDSGGATRGATSVAVRTQ